MFSINQYTLRARVQPGLIVVLPVVLMVLAFLATQPLLATALLGVLGTTVGGTAIISYFGREQGRKKEPGLWKSWDGPPTTRLLRHRRSPCDPEFAPELRQEIEVWSGRSLPTEQQEKDSREWADKVYGDVVASLREATRENSKFPLVFESNINYGFRRNLWGLHRVGITAATIFAVIAWAHLLLTVWGRPWPEPWWRIFASPDSVVVIRMIIAFIDTALVSFWLFRVNKAWIKPAADEYAQRLLVSAQTLNQSRRQ